MKDLWHTLRKGLQLSAILAAIACPLGATKASAAPLIDISPFKDPLFDYPQPSGASRDGTVLDVPYSEARDIDQRDEIPERRVRSPYVELLPKNLFADETLPTPAGPLRWMRVGQISRAEAVVVFVHGRNGDRRLGMNDWTFGGNFNRLKNLMVRAGGAYVTFDGGGLGEADAARVAALIRHIRLTAPETKIVLACGSMGGELCWNLMADKTLAPMVAGLVYLGSNGDEARFERMRKASGEPIPLLLAHGTRDKVYSWMRQKVWFDQVRKRYPSYPIRMVLFDDGNHGTPIRMIDWRDTLNWILKR